MAEFTHLEGTPAEEWQPWLDSLSRFDPWPAMRRLVVVVAHPDDETLGAGGLIAGAVTRGIAVDVVVATWGEASHPDSPTHTRAQLAALRRSELADALAALAQGPVGLDLAHPDVFPSGVASSADAPREGRDAPSAHRPVTLRSLDLPDGQVSLHREEVALVMAGIVDDAQDLDGLWLAVPLADDGHPDHDALGEAALGVARRSGVGVLEFPIWRLWWGDPAAPPELRAVELDDAARAAKRRALACHRSQHEPLSDAPGDEAILQPAFLAHAEQPTEVFRITQPAVDAEDAMEAVHEEPDPWGVDRHFYESRKRALTLAALPRPRYGRVLEVGCSVGALAADLAGLADEVLAVDLSARAVAAAADRLRGIPHARAERLRVPDEWPAGEFDLVVVSETGYYLTPKALGRLVERVDGCLAADGALVLCHWAHPIEGWLLQGDDVHDAFLSDDRFEVLVAHVEPDFRLHVLQRPGRPSPAAREGLV